MKILEGMGIMLIIIILIWLFSSNDLAIIIRYLIFIPLVVLGVIIFLGYLIGNFIL